MSTRAGDPHPLPPGTLRTVASALHVLEVLSRRQPIGVSELARLVELPKSNVQRLLVTLENTGWTRRSDDRTARWEVTTKAFTVGGPAVRRYGLLDVARPIMQRLSDHCSETIHLVIFDTDRLISIDRIESVRAVRIARPLGGSAPLYATAVGRSILSCLDGDEVDRLLQPELKRYTESTITDRPTLDALIAEARANGYGIERVDEWRAGTVSVGSAIQIAPGRPIAGIGISGPANRLTIEVLRELGELVADAAREIGASLTMDLI